MKKPLLIGLFIVLFLIPVAAKAWSLADPIVPCNPNCTITQDQGKTVTNCSKQCKIEDFFTMLGNIYQFIVWGIAGPLAVLALTIGGIFLLISAGNPKVHDTGKKIIYAAIVGLALVFGSYLIIETILSLLKFKNLSGWSKPF